MAAACESPRESASESARSGNKDRIQGNFNSLKSGKKAKKKFGFSVPQERFFCNQRRQINNIVKNMKKGLDNSEPNDVEVPNKKERHIVSWSQEEDDILREQIGLHGTENWAVIASSFTDKSTRQCRRRWFTYLNSDFKKGGWSPEEDAQLLEAQRVYGNRWTEIAKVVSGRTDNAVKNRFTTLCKKRSKQEEVAEENSKIAAYLDFCSRRDAFSNGINGDEERENGAPLKRMRVCVSNTAENQQEILSGPFTVSAHNNVLSLEETTIKASENMKAQGTFLKRDDPKMLALMQQSELLSFLATKVNSEKTDQGLDSAWMVTQDHPKENKGSEEDLRSCNEGSLSLWWESDTYESSPSSSEDSARLTGLPCKKPEEDSNNGSEAQLCLSQENGMCTSNNNTSTNEECSSPLSVTPMFRGLAAAIPSPKFSESEKRFLMKTLGVDSPLSTSRTDPTCKRSLLNCL